MTPRIPTILLGLGLLLMGCAEETYDSYDKASGNWFVPGTESTGSDTGGDTTGDTGSKDSGSTDTGDTGGKDSGSTDTGGGSTGGGSTATAPQQPESVDVMDEGGGEVRIIVTDGSNNETHFEVYVQRTGAPMQAVSGSWGELSGTGNTFELTDTLPASGEYRYYARAINSTGVSPWTSSNYINFNGQQK